MKPLQTRIGFVILASTVLIWIFGPTPFIISVLLVNAYFLLA